MKDEDVILQGLVKQEDEVGVQDATEALADADPAGRTRTCGPHGRGLCRHRRRKL